MSTYTTGLGEQITVVMGDVLYVDEGDSVGDREFSGVVIALGEDRITLRVTATNVITRDPAGGNAETITPSQTADIEVIT